MVVHDSKVLIQGPHLDGWWYKYNQSLVCLLLKELSIKLECFKLKKFALLNWNVWMDRKGKKF